MKRNDDKSQGESLEEILGGMQVEVYLPLGDIIPQELIEASRGIKELEVPELVLGRRKWSKKELRDLHRKPKKKKPRKTGRKRLRYWERRKKNRDRALVYYHKRVKWDNMGKTRWERLRDHCSSKGWVLEISEQELRVMVPEIDDFPGFEVLRIDTKSKVLDKYSVEIRDREGKVRYSGPEQKLIDLGYALSPTETSI